MNVLGGMSGKCGWQGMPSDISHGESPNSRRRSNADAASLDLDLELFLYPASEAGIDRCIEAPFLRLHIQDPFAVCDVDQVQRRSANKLLLSGLGAKGAST